MIMLPTEIQSTTPVCPHSQGTMQLVRYIDPKGTAEHAMRCCAHSRKFSAQTTHTKQPMLGRMFAHARPHDETSGILYCHSRTKVIGPH